MQNSVSGFCFYFCFSFWHLICGFVVFKLIISGEEYMSLKLLCTCHKVSFFSGCFQDVIFVSDFQPFATDGPWYAFHHICYLWNSFTEILESVNLHHSPKLNNFGDYFFKYSLSPFSLIFLSSTQIACILDKINLDLYVLRLSLLLQSFLLFLQIVSFLLIYLQVD